MCRVGRRQLAVEGTLRDGTEHREEPPGRADGRTKDKLVSLRGGTRGKWGGHRK